jgi:hypothetical protein
LPAVFCGAFFRVGSNETALPTIMTVALDSIDRAFVECLEIFSSAFFQVLPEIVLELALGAELTFLRCELVVVCASAAER